MKSEPRRKLAFNIRYNMIIKRTKFFLKICLILGVVSFQPRSLIANLLMGPPSLASLHLGREGSIGVSEGASALRSLSPVSTSLHLRGSYPSARLPRPDHPAVGAGRAMTGSG